jgi:tripartite-type tricarboxylate transporter receptor subunit TctC
MKKLFGLIAVTAPIVSAVVVPLAANAQQPSKIVVGFAPGGTTDVIARMVASGMATRLGKTIIVENRPGASGNIAAQQVANAPADGATLLFVPSSHATNATLYSNQRFDTRKDFSAIGMVASTPYVLAVNPSIPAKTVPELIAYLKANPDKLAYASASPGTAQHLAAELFKKSTGTDMLHVPYKGSAAALPDVISGITPIVFENITVTLPHIKSGGVRPLAVTTQKRSALLPDLPTVTESGVPGYDVSGWFALLAPARTSASTMEQLNKALNQTLKDPAVVKKLTEMGGETIPSTPQQADQLIADEIVKWHGIIQSAKININ